MFLNEPSYFQVDAQGRLVPSEEAAQDYCLKPGSRVVVSTGLYRLLVVG